MIADLSLLLILAQVCMCRTGLCYLQKKQSNYCPFFAPKSNMHRAQVGGGGWVWAQVGVVGEGGGVKLLPDQ